MAFALDDAVLAFDFDSYINAVRFPYQNNKPRQIVCFHWTKSRCMKNEECDELHIWDLDRMPPCKFGDACKGGKTGDCPYKHRTEEEKEECLNYRIGFCSMGRLCDFRHVRRPPEELPPISELFLPNNCFVEKLNRELNRPQANWRTSVCKYIEEFNWCPWFEQCRYAHTEEEVVQWQSRSAFVPKGLHDKRKAEVESAAPDLTSLVRKYDNEISSLRLTGMPDVNAVGSVRYLVVRAADAHALHASVRTGEWTDTHEAGKIVSNALLAVSESSGSSAGVGSVFLFFSIVGSKHFQGVARVRGPPRAVDSGVQVELVGAQDGGPAAPEGGFVSVPIEWLRTCALPFARTASLKNPLVGMSPVAASWPWAELPNQLGKAMLVLSFTAPTVRVNAEGSDASATLHVVDPTTPRGIAAIEGEDVGPEIAGLVASRRQQQGGPGGQAGPGAGPGQGRPGPDRQSGRGGERPAGGSGPQDRKPADPTVNFATDAPRAAPYAPPGTGLPWLTAARGLLLGSRSVGGPGPATPLVEALLAGVVPPGVPPPSAIAADQLLAGGRRVMLLAVNSLSGPVTFAKGVMAASDDPDRFGPNGAPSRAARDLAGITAGTPIVCINLHTKHLLGVYMARGPPVKDLIPGLIPKGGPTGRQFNVHVPFVTVAAPPPMPDSQFVPLLGGTFPTHIGFIAPANSHKLMAAMLSGLPVPEQCAIAGLLLQMVSTRAFPFNLGPDGSPFPLGPQGVPLPPDRVQAVEEAAAKDPWPIDADKALDVLRSGPGRPSDRDRDRDADRDRDRGRDRGGRSPPLDRDRDRDGKGRPRSRSRSRERDTKRARR